MEASSKEDYPLYSVLRTGLMHNFHRSEEEIHLAVEERERQVVALVEKWAALCTEQGLLLLLLQLLVVPLTSADACREQWHYWSRWTVVKAPCM